MDKAVSTASSPILYARLGEPPPPFVVELHSLTRSLPPIASLVSPIQEETDNW